MITNSDCSLAVTSLDIKSGEDTLTLENFSPQRLQQAYFIASGALKKGQSKSSQRLTRIQKAHLKAAYYWLHRYTPPEDATPFQHLEVYLEAHHHLCEAGAWSLQHQLLNQNMPHLALLPDGEGFSRLSKLPTQFRQKSDWLSSSPVSQERSWHQALGELGYYVEQTDVYQKVLSQFTGHQKIPYLQQLGEAYWHLGQFVSAEAIGQELLKLGQAIGDRTGIMQGWEILGNTFRYQGHFQQALNCHYRQLEIAQTLADPKAQASAWTGIGVVQENLKPGKAIQAFLKAQTYLEYLDIKTDLPLFLNILSGLADSSMMAGKFVQAISYASDLLSIATEVNNLFYQYEAYVNLGTAYTMTQRFDLVEFVLQEALKLAHNGHYQAGEIRVLSSLGTLYSFYLKRYPEAIAYFQRALTQSKIINYFQALVIVHCHLVNCYLGVQDKEKAKFHYDQVLEIHPHLQDADCKAIVFGCFARYHWQEGNIKLVLVNLVRCLWIQPPWQSSSIQLILREAKKIIADKSKKWRVLPVANEADTPSIGEGHNP